MACVIYKGTEKLLVDPRAVEGMLAQGWSKEPQENSPPPSAEEFSAFMNMHEELKRVSDTALSLRDDQIHELVHMNEVLTEEIDILQAENIQLKADLEEMSRSSPAESGPEATDSIAHQDYSRLTVQQLQEHAKRANIKNVKSFKKNELIERLQTWELNGGSQPEAQG